MCLHIFVKFQMSSSGAGGAVPVATILDYLQPNINRPDLYYQRAYPIAGGGGGGSNRALSVQRNKADTTERPPIYSVYYTLGIIVLSAAIFISLVAWSNALLSWVDSIYVSPALRPVTVARIQFAWIMTGIALIVIGLALFLWYVFTIQQGV